MLQFNPSCSLIQSLFILNIEMVRNANFVLNLRESLFWYHHYVRPRNICSSVCRLTDIFQESNIDVWRKKVATKKNIKDEPTQMDGSSTLCTAKNCALNEASNGDERKNINIKRTFFWDKNVFFSGRARFYFCCKNPFFIIVVLFFCDAVKELVRIDNVTLFYWL